MGRTGSLNRFSISLERSIKILIVDDEWSIAKAYSEIFRSYKLYKVTCASCAKAADLLLSSSKRFHVCLFDLGLTDINNDEYYLIKKHSPKISFIIVTARDSLKKGFQSKAYGAIAAINKPIDFSNLDFINLVNEAFLRSLIVPKDINKCKPIIKDTIEAFMSLKPTSTKQWAENSGIDERYLRRIWLECFNYQPKYLLCLTKLFQHVFVHYNALYCKNLGIKLPGNETHEPKEIEYFNNQFGLFNAKHKKELNCILNSKY
jgi:DNA-binding NarL/FixJ family response regulator